MSCWQRRGRRSDSRSWEMRSGKVGESGTENEGVVGFLGFTWTTQVLEFLQRFGAILKWSFFGVLSGCEWTPTRDRFSWQKKWRPLFTGNHAVDVGWFQWHSSTSAEVLEGMKSREDREVATGHDKTLQVASEPSSSCGSCASRLRALRERKLQRSSRCLAEDGGCKAAQRGMGSFLGMGKRPPYHCVKRHEAGVRVW